MDKNELIQKLTNEVLLFQKNEIEERTQKEAKEKEERLASLKKQAQDIFDSINEEKMIALAQKGLSKYPLLYLASYRITKNKKTGYRYNVGSVGKFLVEMLEENGFEPVQFRLCDYELKNYFLNKDGYYLGISW